LNKADQTWIDRFYRAEVRPVLTPLAIDPSHPFPMVLNKSLNVIVEVELVRNAKKQRRLALVQVPRILPRLVMIPRTDSRRDYVLLGNLVCHYLSDLFPGAKILGYWHFRVIRNSELYFEEEDVANLLKAVEAELHNRRKGDAVQLSVD